MESYISKLSDSYDQFCQLPSDERGEAMIKLVSLEERMHAFIKKPVDVSTLEPEEDPCIQLEPETSPCMQPSQTDEEEIAPIKRKRGRPRSATPKEIPTGPKRPRGRPPKQIPNESTQTSSKGYKVIFTKLIKSGQVPSAGRYHPILPKPVDDGALEPETHPSIQLEPEKDSCIQLNLTNEQETTTISSNKGNPNSSKLKVKSSLKPKVDPYIQLSQINAEETTVIQIKHGSPTSTKPEAIDGSLKPESEPYIQLTRINEEEILPIKRKRGSLGRFTNKKVSNDDGMSESETDECIQIESDNDSDIQVIRTKKEETVPMMKKRGRPRSATPKERPVSTGPKRSRGRPPKHLSVDDQMLDPEEFPCIQLKPETSPSIQSTQTNEEEITPLKRKRGRPRSATPKEIPTGPIRPLGRPRKHISVDECMLDPGEDPCIESEPETSPSIQSTQTDEEEITPLKRKRGRPRSATRKEFPTGSKRPLGRPLKEILVDGSTLKPETDPCIQFIPENDPIMVSQTDEETIPMMKKQLKLQSIKPKEVPTGSKRPQEHPSNKISDDDETSEPETDSCMQIEPEADPCIQLEQDNDTDIQVIQTTKEEIIPIKKKRGRPRSANPKEIPVPSGPKRSRGRPRKHISVDDGTLEPETNPLCTGEQLESDTDSCKTLEPETDLCKPMESDIDSSKALKPESDLCTGEQLESETYSCKTLEPETDLCKQLESDINSTKTLEPETDLYKQFESDTDSSKTLEPESDLCKQLDDLCKQLESDTD